jgi:hypothetical protein
MAVNPSQLMTKQAPIMNFRPSLSAMVAALALALPTTSLADHHDDWHHGDWHHGGHYYYHRGFYPYPYFGYPFGPSFGVSFYSGPRYYGYPEGPVDTLGVDVQQALRSRGYYRGAIDGIIGPGSRAAIRAYQHDRGLAPTGRIDSPLLRSLRID